MKKLKTGLIVVQVGKRLEVLTQEEYDEVNLDSRKLRTVLVAVAVVFIINIINLILL